MKYIAVYDKDATEYQSSRLCFLENAKDVHIKQAINGDYFMEFKLPKKDKKWQYLGPENKVGYDGKIFRIKEYKGTTVTAVSLIQDSCRTHIPYIGDMISTANHTVTAYEIFTKIFSFTPYVTALTEEQVKALGMEPVDDPMDFFELSKKTPIGCMNNLLERLNKYRIHSEVYIDNDKIALVRQIGKDRGVTVDPKYNANDLNSECSTYTLITKLYPYGRDDLPLKQTEDEEPFILSPNYDVLGEYEGFCNFDEITNPQELRDAAEWQFDEDNLDRIDVPKYAIPFKFIDLEANEKIRPGDTVTVNDRDHGIISKQRVTAVDIYPFEPNRSTFEVGKTSVTMDEALTTMYTAAQYLRLNKTVSDNLKTDALEFMESNEDVYLDSDSGEQKIAKYKTGALFVSPNELYAVAIMDGKIKVGTADASKSDGWRWTGVFGRGQVTVSEVFTGELFTDLVKILSEDGTLTIEGNLIQMFDNNETLRFNAGYAVGINKYIFELYDENGKRTLYMDDNGNLTLTGIFKTGEDGTARTVIDGNGIQSFDENGQADGLFANSTSYNADVHTLTLYEHGSELFKVFSGTMGVHISLDGDPFLICNGNTVRFGKTLMYNNSEVANKSDIENLQAQINSLKGNVS